MTTAKLGAPVVGFNHNVKYGPRVYHVQTEDSGLPHAHYITHLFVGGNIVASMKTSYADKASDPELQKVVRSLMEGQHKAMLKRLVSGEFNEMAERVSQSYAPGVLADGSNQASYVNDMTARAATPAAVKPAPKPAAPPPSRLPPPPVMKPAAPPAAKPAAPPRPPQPVWQPAPPSRSQPAAPRSPGQPLPATTRAPGAPTRPNTPPRIAPVTAPPPRPAAPPAKQRPAAPTFFSESPVEMPHEDLPTLFAEELISEKSLDEVILAFLSADIEPPK
jgi:hypothetical protein